MIMDVAFSAAKDRLNRVKHGVSLGDAALIDWAHAVKWEDARKDYGETRLCALGEIAGRVFLVVYVDRGTDRRIISLRRANKREIDRYVQRTNQP